MLKHFIIYYLFCTKHRQSFSFAHYMNAKSIINTNMKEPAGPEFCYLLGVRQLFFLKCQEFNFGLYEGNLKVMWRLFEIGVGVKGDKITKMTFIHEGVIKIIVPRNLVKNIFLDEKRKTS